MHLPTPSGGFFEPICQKIQELAPSERVVASREYIDSVEDWLLASFPGQFDAQINHQLSDGVYVRTMLVPAGVLVTGLIHRKSCLTVLMEGTISVMTEHGSAILSGPQMFFSAPGIRRLGYTHTPVVWATIHSTQLTDLEAIEDELFDVEYEDEK